MIVVQLTSSPFFGGPERQMLGLALSLPREYRSVFVLFGDRGRHRAFLDEIRGHGFEGFVLQHDTPHFPSMIQELSGRLTRLGADVLCCSGYKADLLGWRAARRAGVPVLSVSHGWTGANLRAKVYEALDRKILPWMDYVVCVSEAQAARVRRAGVPAGRTGVIRNAIRTEPFAHADPSYKDLLHGFFPKPPRRVVGAAGRLSPEKGFGVLVEAAGVVLKADPTVGFVLFGDGPLRQPLARQIEASGLAGRFILAGFRTDVERFLPHVDVVALPSFTEGLPVVVLEAFAAGVPVVATAVGGTPEVVQEGVNGYLVPPGQPAALAQRLLDVLRSEPRRQTMGLRGKERVEGQFTFEAQSRHYQRLFTRFARKPHRPAGGCLPFARPR